MDRHRGRTSLKNRDDLQVLTSRNNVALGSGWVHSILERFPRSLTAGHLDAYETADRLLDLVRPVRAGMAGGRRSVDLVADTVGLIDPVSRPRLDRRSRPGVHKVHTLSTGQIARIPRRLLIRGSTSGHPRGNDWPGSTRSVIEVALKRNLKLQALNPKQVQMAETEMLQTHRTASGFRCQVVSNILPPEFEDLFRASDLGFRV